MRLGLSGGFYLGGEGEKVLQTAGKGEMVAGEQVFAVQL